MRSKPVVTKRRKHKKDLPSDNSVITQIVLMYSRGSSIEEISETTGWNEKSIQRDINRFFSSFKDVLETNLLVQTQALEDGTSAVKNRSTMQLYQSQQKIDRDINSEFISKLSDNNDTVLTHEEMMFCYLLVHEGDAQNALLESGLSKGLQTSGTGYKRACRLRVLMLKGKRNLIKYINDLQISYAKDLNIGKESIQSEIMQQLKHLKEQDDPRNAPTIAKLTEQLGRTVGAFTDKITIEEVSFDDAMDRMLEMRKADTKEVSQSGVPDKDLAGSASIPTPTFVYDPDRIG